MLLGTLKINTKTGKREFVEKPTYATYADLPEPKADGQVEYVRETTGLIGFRKFAGWYVYENGWQLLAKAE